MLTEKRRLEIELYLSESTGTVSRQLIQEVLKEYDALYQTWRDCESEKLRIAAMEAHYRQECSYLKSKEDYGI